VSPPPTLEGISRDTVGEPNLGTGFPVASPFVNPGVGSTTSAASAFILSICRSLNFNRT